MKIIKKNNQTIITKKSGVPFRILQITDIHIGGGFMSKKTDALSLKAVERIIESAKPDFIAITGDIAYPIPIFSGTRNNMKASKMFGEVITKYNIPWAVAFGNHDSESFAKYTKEQVCEYYMSLSNCLMQKGEDDIMGCGNYSIKLLNEDGSMNNMLMFIDSNAYLTWNFFSGFDVIYDNQIDWYKRAIKAEEKDGKLPPSLAFYHIPPIEFKEAWMKCYRGSDEVVYHHGFVGEKDNYFGYPKTKDCNFFNEMVKLGSCKGMFMGHDHLSCVSLTYKGIRMSYGMSIDYMAYSKIAKKITQRGGTIIEVYDDSSFDVKLLPLEDII